jgi:hypothetical protein
MAKKARFFEVTLKDGHKEEKIIRPAQRGSDLKKAMENQHVKVVKIKSLNFQKVSAKPDEDDRVMFCAQIDGASVNIYEGEQGFDYLTQQFPEKVEQVLEQIEYTGP